MLLRGEAIDLLRLSVRRRRDSRLPGTSPGERPTLAPPPRPGAATSRSAPNAGWANRVGISAQGIYFEACCELEFHFFLPFSPPKNPSHRVPSGSGTGTSIRRGGLAGSTCLPTCFASTATKLVYWLISW